LADALIAATVVCTSWRVFGNSHLKETEKPMTQKISEILKEAMKLPPEGRAALAGSLIKSLEESVDRDAEAVWEAEIDFRLKEIDQGKVNLIPWAEARARIAGQ
jgi:putative addiction module component (TIGR02574 family)